MTAPPAEVDWSALSLRSREIILHVGMRQAGGFTLDEVVAVLDRERPEMRHNDLPPRVTKGWVQARLRDVRHEIEATNAASG